MAANNEQDWISPPFQLTGKNGYLYGRGATDNKGPLLTYAHALKEYLEEYAEMVIASDAISSSETTIDPLTPQQRKKKPVLASTTSLPNKLGVMSYASSNNNNNNNNNNNSGTINSESHNTQKIGTGETQPEGSSNVVPLPWEVIILAEGQGQHDWKNGGLQQVIEKNLDWLHKPALVLLSNSSWLGDDVPCLVYGMRGFVSMQCQVIGPTSDVHSGIHGGAFNEPTLDLIHILSKLKTPDTKSNSNNVEEVINIPRFYDRIDPITEDERKTFEEVSFDVEGYARHIGVSKLKSNNSAELLMKRTRCPSLSIHAFQTSSQQETVISKKASAVISIRTVPSQNNIEIFDLTKKFLMEKFAALKSGNELKIDLIHAADHWSTDRREYYFQAAEEAIFAHWNIKPHYVREGGTSPSTNYLASKLSAPCLQLPLGQESDNAHLENERIRLENLLKGKEGKTIIADNYLYMFVWLIVIFRCAFQPQQLHNAYPILGRHFKILCHDRDTILLKTKNYVDLTEKRLTIYYSPFFS
ncbi:hypothetical protein RFI_31643 [Reticulomyxa filosa]|uniref:Uncharacterized protein n=1 Tax=Reticulomyxa filosa TaxID=46433 RepID=X6LUY9_RETFI|nr:hypothetical protein RFI_31643 [Reticulomyxa filosa]|eukprot:ETO05748.1 hypothetical protein RFI_31643 [Reticulomyxa filosa]